MARSAKEGSCRSALAVVAGRVLAGHLVALPMPPGASATSRWYLRRALGQPDAMPGIAQVTWPTGRSAKVSRASAAAGRPVGILVKSPPPCALPVGNCSSYPMQIVIGPMPFVLNGHLDRRSSTTIAKRRSPRFGRQRGHSHSEHSLLGR
jgi:hypothetical protein